MARTKCLVDGTARAEILEHFPEGSTSYLFPHYAVRHVGSSERVIVRSDRVTRADDGVALTAEGFPR